MQLSFKIIRHILQDSKKSKFKPIVPDLKIPEVSKSQFLNQSFDTLWKLSNNFKRIAQFDSKVTVGELGPFQSQGWKFNVKIRDLGELDWRTNQQQNLLYYQSPLTGVFRYFWQGEWLQLRDRHNMIQNLGRELGNGEFSLFGLSHYVAVTSLGNSEAQHGGINVIASQHCSQTQSALYLIC